MERYILKCNIVLYLAFFNALFNCTTFVKHLLMDGGSLLSISVFFH